jgi:hypothetical protein
LCKGALVLLLFGFIPSKMKTYLRISWLAIASSLSALLAVHGQSYSINWYKVAGGGGTSAGGQYSVSGTIGQPAASGAMMGGSYSLTGGFWSLFALQTSGAPRLTITYSGNKAIVSWPVPSTGWTLQTNGNLASSSWVSYGNAVTNNTVANSLSTGNLFFRLSHP